MPLAYAFSLALYRVLSPMISIGSYVSSSSVCPTFGVVFQLC